MSKRPRIQRFKLPPQLEGEKVQSLQLETDGAEAMPYEIYLVTSVRRLRILASNDLVTLRGLLEKFSHAASIAKTLATKGG